LARTRVALATLAAQGGDQARIRRAGSARARQPPGSYPRRRFMRLAIEAVCRSASSFETTSMARRFQAGAESRVNSRRGTRMLREIRLARNAWVKRNSSRLERARSRKSIDPRAARFDIHLPCVNMLSSFRLPFALSSPAPASRRPVTSGAG